MRREPYWAVIGVELIGNDNSTMYLIQNVIKDLRRLEVRWVFFLLSAAFYHFLLFSAFMTLNETHQKKNTKLRKQ